MILVAGCEGGSIWCRHARRTKLGELDCGVLGEPSASAEQADTYLWDTDYYFVAAGAVGDDRMASPVVDRGVVVLLWVAAAVCRTRDRRKASGVSEGLAISPGGVPVVGGEDAREGLASSRGRRLRNNVAKLRRLMSGLSSPVFLFGVWVGAHR